MSHVLITSGNRIIADKHYMTFDKVGHQATIIGGSTPIPTQAVSTCLWILADMW